MGMAARKAARSASRLGARYLRGHPVADLLGRVRPHPLRRTPDCPSQFACRASIVVKPIRRSYQVVGRLNVYPKCLFDPLSSTSIRQNNQLGEVTLDTCNAAASKDPCIDVPSFDGSDGGRAEPDTGNAHLV
jgi:hypothetical protein